MAGNPGFLGMRGTGDWATNERPENWRQGILRLYPNGSAPLTAIQSMMGSEKTNDATFHWWSKLLPSQAATITGIYTDSILSTAYVSSGAAGDVIYFKMSASDLTHFRVGHVVLLRDQSDLAVDVVAKVVARSSNGASSYIACKLREADDNSSDGDLSDCDRALVIGNANPEGDAMPDALAYDPTEWYNYTQIWKTPLSITRTARLTKLRTEQAYKEAKREALELHSIEMEKSAFWGIRYSGTGDNGLPERMSMGLIQAIVYGSDGTNNVGTVDDFTTNTDYSGQTWLQGGEEWLDEQLEVIFRYGAAEKMAWCGSGTMLGIQRLVKNSGHYNISKGEAGYGIKVREWETPFGTIYMKTHPLFSFETTNRNVMVIHEPSNMKIRTITDTTFQGENPEATGYTKIDGTKEQYLTELGWEYHHPNGWGYLKGFNTDNDLS